MKPPNNEIPPTNIILAEPIGLLILKDSSILIDYVAKKYLNLLSKLHSLFHKNEIKIEEFSYPRMIDIKRLIQEENNSLTLKISKSASKIFEENHL